MPWQRVIGSGGYIKLRFEAAAEQRLRLELEGVKFRGRRVDLSAHQHMFGAWDVGQCETALHGKLATLTRDAPSARR